MTKQQVVIDMKCILILMILLSQSVFALETPHSGRFDRRVKHINYNQQQVVKLVGHYGFSTDIAFAVGEAIKQIAMGDADAWAVTPVDNHIFIKPKAEIAVTNMTVLTNKRVYNFELSAHWSKNGAHPHPNDMMFSVQFNYPNANKLKRELKTEKQQLQKQLNSTAKPQVKIRTICTKVMIQFYQFELLMMAVSPTLNSIRNKIYLQCTRLAVMTVKAW